MSEVGAFEFQKSDGSWHEVKLYTPGTFDVEPIEIQLSDGSWGVPYLRAPSNADTPLEVQKSDGSWLGINSVGILIIDDFEDGDHSGWTVPSSTGDDTIVSPGLNDTDYAWEHDGFREGHLAGADAVNRGPQPDDVFEVWWRIESVSSGDGITRFEFSADGTSDGDKYRVEWESSDTSNKTVSMEKYVGGSVDKVATADFAPSTDTVYRAEIRWNNGSNDIEVEMYDASGSSVSNPATITDDSSAAGSEYTQPGIYIMTNANVVQTWDEMRILPS